MYNLDFEVLLTPNNNSSNISAGVDPGGPVETVSDQFDIEHYNVFPISDTV